MDLSIRDVAYIDDTNENNNIFPIKSEKYNNINTFCLINKKSNNNSFINNNNNLNNNNNNSNLISKF
jgi:hypothetical protein